MHALATFWLMAAGAAGKAATIAVASGAGAAAAANSSVGGGGDAALGTAASVANLSTGANAGWAFLLLVASLVVFIVSTRQWPLLQRALIWGLGTVLLVLAGTLTWTTRSQATLFQLMSNAADGEGAEGSYLSLALSGNLDLIVAYFTPLLNTLLVLTILAGLASLLAFTPGERLEQVVRQSVAVVGGAIAGAIIVLTLVAIGFGANAKRRVIFGNVNTVNCVDDTSGDEKAKKADKAKCGVVDGDGIIMGDVSIRLAGIEALERDQTCFDGKIFQSCGQNARQNLKVKNAILFCFKPGQLGGDEAEIRFELAEESFGRPIMTCEALSLDGKRNDIAKVQAEDGYAVQYESSKGKSDPTYKESVGQAQANNKGPMWTTCTLKPRVWRNNKAARDEFKEKMCWRAENVLDAGKCREVGLSECPPQTTTSPGRSAKDKSKKYK